VTDEGNEEKKWVDRIKANHKRAVTLAEDGKLNEALEGFSEVAEDTDTLISVVEQKRLVNFEQASKRARLLESIFGSTLDSLNYLKWNKATLDYNVALILYNQNKLDESLIKVNEVIDHLRSIKPIRFMLDFVRILRASVLNLKGVILLRLGHYETAIQYFAESIQDNKNSDVLNNKGICHAEIGETKTAIQTFNESIEIGNEQIKQSSGSPEREKENRKNVAKVILNMAFVYFIMDYKEEAFDKISKELLLLLGTNPTYSLYQDFDKWLEDLMANFELESRDLYIIALILYMKEMKDNALTVLDKALAAEKSLNPYLWYQKGNIFLKQADYPEALRCYGRATDIKPTIAEAHNNAAVVLAHNSNYDESKKHLAEAIRINPAMAVAHENIARLAMNDTAKRQDFWQYWGASTRKKAVAIALSLIAAAVVILGIMSPFYGSTSDPLEENAATSKNIKTSNESTTVTTTEETTSTKHQSESVTPEVKIPESYLVIVALVVLVILSPQLKSLKAGPVEVELQTRESVEIDTTLRPSQEAFVSQGGYIEPPGSKS
jgi:tetratricopeptide (TPR) repeat protein